MTLGAKKNITFSFVLQTNPARRDFPRKIKCTENNQPFRLARFAIRPSAGLAADFSTLRIATKDCTIARNEMQLRRKEENETTRRLHLKQAESLIAATIPECCSEAHMGNKIALASLNAGRDDRVAEEK